MPSRALRPAPSALPTRRRGARLLGLALAAAWLWPGPAPAIDDYKLGPDSSPKEGVPQGAVTKHSWTSRVFPGTVRDYWVYVPAQYDAATPACVMVFQDGEGYAKRDGSWRVPVVFDNLIHRKEMPVTIGVFINPGVVPAAGPDVLARFNRSYEYDGMSDEYARFLVDEILPEVGKSYNLSKDPACRAIAGASSGAIAAFTAAWHRPDQFGRVFSTIGTYVGLRGGDVYPTLVRKTEPKPLRVFLQDGSNDLDIYAGSWWIANQSMLSSLKFAGYEVEHVWGDGAHNGKHGAAILPDALRWLWKDFGKPIKAGVGSKQPVLDVVSVDEPWQLVAEGFKFTEGPATNARGELFFTDIPNDRIHKVGLDGKVSVFVERSGGANGLMFGPDGRLYAAQNGKKRVVAYDEGGRETVLATGIESNDLAVSHRGHVYVTDPTNKRVWLLAPAAGAAGKAPKYEKRVVDTGLNFPNGVLFTPDQSLLYVVDMKGRFVYSYQVRPDGSLDHKQAYCHLHIPDDKLDSGGDGMAVDAAGRLYVTTHMGVQFCDQAGRVQGIIAKPQPKWLANVVFGGPDLGELYVTSSDRVYKRRTKVKGVLSFQPPVKPPTPRL
jgi:sugar lactone lactonase YvrE/enterochelin esterase-like enzyme